MVNLKQSTASSGERKTKQKKAVSDAFATANRPLSPQEVLAIASGECPGIGIATIYRIIKDMVDRKELCVVELPGGPLRYEANGKGHHHHFHCRDCDRVFDFSSCPGKNEIKGPRGFIIESHEIILHGLCAQCK